MEQWEYSVHSVFRYDKDVKEKAMGPWLNELGRQGWELVAAVATDTSYKYTLFFKRRVAA